MSELNIKENTLKFHNKKTADQQQALQNLRVFIFVEWGCLVFASRHGAADRWNDRQRWILPEPSPPASFSTSATVTML